LIGGEEQAAMNRRFRVIDMVVAVLIAGSFAGLLMKWATEARERSRRVQCQNNMRNLGLNLSR
jgi:hypothetical protein